MKILYLIMPFQTPYRIKTNCKFLENDLCLKYGKYVSQEYNQTCTEILVIEKGKTFLVEFQTKSFETHFPLYEVEKIIFENRQYDEKILALHGAAVGHCGKAYVFLASTTSGKTTLTSFLTSKGLGYITDDCILLDRANFSVYPNSTPIHLREGGVEVLRGCNMLPESLCMLNEIPSMRYVYTPANSIFHKLPLGKIYFISRTETENKLVKMDTNERIKELLKSQITNYELTSEHLRLISRLSAIDCKQLFYCNMSYVEEVIGGESDTDKSGALKTN